MSKTIKELKEELKNKISYQEGLGKPTYEDVLEDFYYDETDDTNDYIVCSGCKSEIKMLFMRIDYLGSLFLFWLMSPFQFFLFYLILCQHLIL